MPKGIHSPSAPLRLQKRFVGNRYESRDKDGTIESKELSHFRVQRSFCTSTDVLPNATFRSNASMALYSKAFAKQTRNQFNPLLRR